MRRRLVTFVLAETSEGMRLPGRYSVVEHPAVHVSGSIRQATLLQGDNLGLQQKQLQQTHYRTWADTGISGALRSKL